jgi:hypothetical protein
MFHGKHFCKVEAKKLTRPHTSGGLRRMRLGEKEVSLAIGGALLNGSCENLAQILRVRKLLLCGRLSGAQGLF